MNDQTVGLPNEQTEIIEECVVCPGCGYQDPNVDTFDVCLKCGLVISKYLKRQRNQELHGDGRNEPSSGSSAFPRTVLRSVKAILQRDWIRLAIGLLILFAGGKLAGDLISSMQLRAKVKSDQNKR